MTHRPIGVADLAEASYSVRSESVRNEEKRQTAILGLPRGESQLFHGFRRAD